MTLTNSELKSDPQSMCVRKLQHTGVYLPSSRRHRVEGEWGQDSECDSRLLKRHSRKETRQTGKEEKEQGTENTNDGK